MLVIARHGFVQFIENNPAILIMEIVMAALISLFGIVVFILQITKLREKRRDDEKSLR